MHTNRKQPFEFKLKKKEDLTENFCHLVSGMNDAAVSLCNFRTLKFADRRVHEIRKTMKRMRAVLKLYRTATGEEFYLEENAFYRDTSKLISELRVGSVRLKTMTKMKDKSELRGRDLYFGDLMKDMRAIHQAKMQQMILEEKMQRSISIALRNNRQRIRHMNEFPCEFEMISYGLRRMYRKCTLNLDMAMRQPSAEHIHNFRKPVKYLWNQMTLLRPIWPLAFGQAIRNLDRLGERLGDEHDLADLEQYLWSQHHAEVAAEPLIQAIRKERKRIQRNVWPLSMKVFAESPNAFAKRVHAYWKIW